MVHALHEAWRVLKPNGIMLDMRPDHACCSLEVLTDGDNTQTVAMIEPSPAALADDLAADLAIQQVIEENPSAQLVKASQRGLFHLEARTQFDFIFQWEDADQMQRYITSTWQRRHRIPLEGEWQEIHQKIFKLGAYSSIQSNRSVRLVQYRRAS